MDKKITELDAVVTPTDADLLTTLTNLSTTPANEKITWTVAKAFLKTYFDGLYADVLGADDNYVTDDEKVVIGNTSGENTGDQEGDGVTITGTGTSADPFVSVATGDGDFLADGSVPMTGRLDLATGTTSLAPMKIPAGTLKTTPTSGEIEYNGSDLFITI